MLGVDVNDDDLGQEDSSDWKEVNDYFDRKEGN